MDMTDGSVPVAADCARLHVVRRRLSANDLIAEGCLMLADWLNSRVDALDVGDCRAVLATADQLRVLAATSPALSS